MVRRCCECHTPIDNLHPNAIRCQECQRLHRLELNALYMQRRRANSVQKKLGTTDFSPHRKATDSEEHEAILKEMRKLGLR